jgi:hypothetical protein
MMERLIDREIHGQLFLDFSEFFKILLKILKSFGYAFGGVQNRHI